MGCDIHCFVEVRNKDTKKWEFMEPDGRWGVYEEWVGNKGPKVGDKDFKQIYSDRNYGLFGCLAGVRSEEYDGYSTPRRWPRNLDPRLESTRDDGFLHSHSYFTLRELLEWDLWRSERGKAVAMWFYADVVGELMLLGEPDDVRLLFCFDN